ncbi:hypothetical protein AUJ84_03765 [Candidatus Pacearchaeota archaeon CG1_02_32_132]|nr:MAG: hypothetical protein AUJ84_03765 [Candidatus Pacearchaeota archaeon CG1_02_32_132]
MIAVPRQSINEVLELYNPEQRFLQSMSIDDNLVMTGRFIIGQNGTHQEAAQEDADICLSQMVCASMYEKMRRGGNIGCLSDFHSVRKRSHLTISPRIFSKIPTGEIKAEMRLVYMRKQIGQVSYVCDFEFECGVYQGRLTFDIIGLGAAR